MAYSQQVDVITRVKVTVDETKFTPQFMEEFRQSFYPFDTIDEHIRHLAQLFAREIADETDFIEGYGMPAEMGIKFLHISGDEEVV